MSAADTISAPRFHARAPGAFLGGLSLIIVILMLAALSPAQPPPPPTAEYAPEAVRSLREAPPEQTSLSGTGAEGTGAGGTGQTAAPPPSAPGQTQVDSKRVRRCVGNPPRQIEDPQSPPCIAYWEGDNGGATSPKGVTANEVRVAVPAEYGAGGGVTIKLFEKFFNSRFIFYDRSLVLVQSDCGSPTPGGAKDCAKSIDSRNVFASLSYRDIGGNEYFYYDELARRGVVSINTRPETRTDAHFAEFAPYEWGYLPSLDQMSRHIAELICKELAAKPATHAGQRYTSQTRKFGLVSNYYTNAPSPDMTILKGSLASCGVSIPPEQQFEVQYEQEGISFQQVSETSAQQSANAMAQMSSRDVTTVICMCHTTTTKQVAPAADSIGYQPEWIISSFLYQDENLFGAGQPQSQWTHAFGLSFWNKAVEAQNQPWYWATQEIDPNYDYEKNRFVYFGARYLYHQILQMASGIQMAGPRLTAQTFQDGLWNTRFPNPDSPYFAGKVGFANRDHTFIDDAAIIWWDPASRDPWLGGQGAFCYVRKGERNALGKYPRVDEPFPSPPICAG